MIETRKLWAVERFYRGRSCGFGYTLNVDAGMVGYRANTRDRALSRLLHITRKGARESCRILRNKYSAEWSFRVVRVVETVRRVK